MRRTVLSAAVILAVGLAGHGLAKDPPASESSNLIQELGVIGERMNRALVEGRYAAMLHYYAEDAVVMAPGEAKRVGKKAIQAGIEENRHRGVVFETFSTRTEKAWECGGLVYAAGSYAMSASTPSLARPVADRGKFFSVWQRDSTGTLKVLYDIWNSDVEPGK